MRYLELMHYSPKSYSGHDNLKICLTCGHLHCPVMSIVAGPVAVIGIVASNIVPEQVIMAKRLFPERGVIFQIGSVECLLGWQGRGSAGLTCLHVAATYCCHTMADPTDGSSRLI